MKFEKLIHKGNKKDVYLVDGTAVKVFAKDYSKADVLYEALNTARVEDAGMPIPKLLSLGVQDEQWYIQSEYIEGTTLAELMEKKPKEKDKLLEKMVIYQIDMNKKSNPLLGRLTDKYIRLIEETDLDSNVKYELLTKLSGMHKHTKLLHGDYSPENIIVDKRGHFHVCDWVHATQGNASADIARTYLLLALKSEEDAKKYLKIFCEKTGTKESYVQEWLPIVAAAQLTKNRPEEKDLLEKWCDVIDFQ